MTISEANLNEARQAWGDGLIENSLAYETGGIDQARETAKQVIENLYGYGLGPVLFKPTLSGGEKTFRTNFEGALSYFVGHSDDYPQDGGFGIKYWREVTSETAACYIEGDTALWMGWVTFTDKDGNMVKVDKSFGYKKDADGALKIVLHHSSLPFDG